MAEPGPRQPRARQRQHRPAGVHAEAGRYAREGVRAAGRCRCRCRAAVRGRPAGAPAAPPPPPPPGGRGRARSRPIPRRRAGSFRSRPGRARRAPARPAAGPPPAPDRRRGDAPARCARAPPPRRRGGQAEPGVRPLPHPLQQPRVAHQAQMARQARLALAEDLGELGHGERPAPGERQDAQPGGFGRGAQCGEQILHHRAGRDPLSARPFPPARPRPRRRARAA